MTARVVAAAAVLAAIAAGCWWMLRSAATDDPAPLPASADVAPPTKPRSRIARHRAADASNAADAAKPPSPFGFAGLVVHVTADETQAPIAGADVYVADRSDKEKSAKTDADGVARIGRLVQGPVQVLVEAKGFARGLEGFQVVWDEREVDSFLALERAAEATGVVLDENGRPFAGASVMATDARDDWLDPDATPIAETTSAADGTFRAAPLPAKSPSFLQITAPNYAVTTIAWTSSAGRVEARLVRSGALSGVVREPSGRPAVGAHVTAESDAPETLSLGETTDDRGRFSFEKLPAGVSWTLRAEKDGFIDSLPSKFAAGEATAAERTLALRRRPRLEFAVLDAAGAPVNDAEIDVKDPAGRPDMKRTEKGSATFELVEAGRCRFVIDDPRFAPHEEDVEIEVGGTRQIAVRLDGGVPLAGVVVDDAGAPVADASIEVAGGAIEGFGPWTRTTTSRADGTFRVAGLKPGECGLVVISQGLRTFRGVQTAPSDALRVTLPRFARLSIRLRAPEGGPTPDVVDVACELPDDVPATDELFPEYAKRRKPWRDREWSDELLLSAGKWNVTIDAKGYLPVKRGIEVAFGGQAAIDDVVLDRGQSITGVVVDDLGAPVARATVSMREASGNGWTNAETDAGGAFRFDLIPRSFRAVDVVALQRGGDQVEVSNVAPPPEPMRLVLRRNGRVIFRVRGPNDVPLESPQVFVEGAKFGDVPASGECRVSLAPGRRRIQVQAVGFAPSVVAVDVAPGVELRLPDVTLGDGATLVGRVVDGDGRGVARAEVQLNYENLATRNLETDASGEFRVDHLPAATIYVWVRAAGYADAEVELASVSDAPLVVTLKRGDRR